MSERKTRKFGGKIFKKGSVYKTKRLAEKSAKRTRDAGGAARVVKDGSGYRVYRRKTK